MYKAGGWPAEAKRLVENIKTKTIKFRLYYTPICGSTQDVARSLAEAGASEGTVVLAEEMKRGRGRGGRLWHAPPGGLWFTLILRPKSTSALNLLAILSSLSVARSVQELFGLDAKVKWPNDVVVEGRKLSGSLVEAKIQGSSPAYALLGIGVNVNNSIPDDIGEIAISLKSVLKQSVSRTVLLCRILELLDLYYSMLLAGMHNAITEEWKRVSIVIGRRVKVELDDNRVLVGTAINLNDRGSLLLELDSGAVMEVQPYRAKSLRLL